MMLISLISSLSLGSVSVAPTQPSTAPIVAELLNPVQSASQSSAVDTIARQVTVRVTGSINTGSGVLIGRQGNTYQVLTCDHVVISRKQAPTYTVFTSVGKTYSARRLVIPELRSLDLAILEFDSPVNYPLVRLGSLDRLQPGAPVYAVGFPNYRYYSGENRVESTKNWGMRAFQMVSGQFSMLLDRPLMGGYRLGYNNEVRQGMSGGAVLDANGLLIGINGRPKYPLQGIDTYKFMDGTRPSTKLSSDLERLSWAIPISSFQQTITQLQHHKLSQR
ncbi:trypsin-like peptidase domain-containing protein [Cyanobacteria bacterium FACHB-63]|nr:trypsin-like peptidase domain-containing protein [Cyanobacteria bacterium FACHB-63]